MQGGVAFDLAAIQQHFEYDEVWLLLEPVRSA